MKKLLFSLFILLSFTCYSQDTLYITGKVIFYKYKDEYCTVNKDSTINHSGYIIINDSVLSLSIDNQYDIPEKWFSIKLYGYHNSYYYMYPKITLEEFENESKDYWFIFIVSERQETNLQQGRLFITYSRKKRNFQPICFTYSNIKS